MFGPIGGSEFLMIAVLALLLFGPRKLPQLGRGLGRALAEFRSASRDFRASLEREVQMEELKDVNKELTSTGREIQQVARDVGRDGDETGDS